MKCRTFCCFCLFTFVLTSATFAQLSMNEFFQSALEDPEVRTFDDQIKYLNSKPYRLAPLREVQFRTQNRELEETQQEYALRLSPSNPWELRRHNKYFMEMNSSLGFEKELALKDALMDRYLTTIEYLYYRAVNDLTATSKQKLDQQIAILEKQSGSRYFDPEDYVDLRTGQLDFLIEEEEISFELSNQIGRITRTYPKAHNQRIEWSFNSVISVESIKRIVDSVEQAAIVSSMVSYYEQKIRLANSEYLLERANFNIGFLQASYDRRRFNQDRTPFNLSLGISLPIFNPNKGDMARRKLEVIEAEYDFEEETYQSESDKAIAKEKLLSLIVRADNLEKKINDLETSNLPQTLSTIKGGDPVAIIQFGQRVDKMKTLYYKVKRELFLSYVDYLYVTDALQKKPLINYLSPSLSRIEN